VNDEKDARVDRAPATTPAATPQVGRVDEVAPQPPEEPFEKTLIIAPGALAEHLARAPREGTEVATTDLAARAPRASAGDTDERARPRPVDLPGPRPPAGSDRVGLSRAVKTVVVCLAIGLAIGLAIALAMWVVPALP